MKTFIHNFSYSIKILVRNKQQMLWSMLFIIALGSLFYVSFGKLYEREEMLNSIKVAAVIEDDDVAANFDSMAANITIDEESNEKLLDIVDVSGMDEAKKLLTDEKIEGVFYSEDGELRLMIYDEGITESILSSIAGQYHQIVTVIAELSDTAPDKIPDVISGILNAESNNTEEKTTEGNMDVYLEYFYNLIAMACLMSVTAGIAFTVNNQANLSTIGARKCISGAASFIQSASGILATIIVQTVCALIGLLYLVLIGVDFGSQTGYICLMILCGCFAGTCIGFFIGSIGNLSENVKLSIGTTIIVGTAFLSGLMIGDMRMVVEENCPIINKINPTALIADSFYALQIYDTYDRYFTNLISILIIAVLSLIAGVLVGRRKTYASI